jgi:hypothetical protein
MSVPMCADVETMGSFRNSHRPTSVPMCHYASPHLPPSGSHIGRHRWRCVTTPRHISPFRISHRPISVPMCHYASPHLPPSGSHIGRHRWRCVTTPRHISPFRISHRPTSVPMCHYASPHLPLQDLTSADIGTDVSQLVGFSEIHIGRHRYRCCRRPCPLSSSHRPMSVPMCGSWVGSLRITTSADVGADVHQLDRSLQE